MRAQLFIQRRAGLNTARDRTKTKITTSVANFRKTPFLSAPLPESIQYWGSWALKSRGIERKKRSGIKKNPPRPPRLSNREKTKDLVLRF